MGNGPDGSDIILFDSFDRATAVSSYCHPIHWTGNITSAPEMDGGFYGANFSGVLYPNNLEYPPNTATILNLSTNKAWLTFHANHPAPGDSTAEGIWFLLGDRVANQSRVALGYNQLSANTFKFTLNKANFGASAELTSVTNVVIGSTTFTNAITNRVQLLYDTSTKTVDELWVGAAGSEISQLGAAYNCTPSAINKDMTWYLHTKTGSKTTTKLYVDSMIMNSVPGTASSARPSNNWRVYGYVPTRDVANVGWNLVGSPPITGKNRFHQVDDFNDGYTGNGGGQLSNGGVATAVEQFAFGPWPGGSVAAVNAVYCANSGGTPSGANIWWCDSLVKVTETWKATYTGSAYNQRTLSPANTPWTSAVMTNLQVGFMNTASATNIMEMFALDVVGTALVKNTPNLESVDQIIVDSTAYGSASGTNQITYAMTVSNTSNRRLVALVGVDTPVAINNVRWRSDTPGNELTRIFSIYLPWTYGQSTGANTSNTMNDTGQSWTVDYYAGKWVSRLSGDGTSGYTTAIETKYIASNSPTCLYISGSWDTIPASNAYYAIHNPWRVDGYYMDSASVTTANMYVNFAANVRAASAGFHAYNVNGHGEPVRGSTVAESGSNVSITTDKAKVGGAYLTVALAGHSTVAMNMNTTNFVETMDIQCGTFRPLAGYVYTTDVNQGCLWSYSDAHNQHIYLGAGWTLWPVERERDPATVTACNTVSFPDRKSGNPLACSPTLRM